MFVSLETTSTFSCDCSHTNVVAEVIEALECAAASAPILSLHAQY